jgi:hypothetical protein
MIRDFITWKSRNGFPNFPGDGKLFSSHVPNLPEGWYVVRAGAGQALRVGSSFYNTISGAWQAGG